VDEREEKDEKDEWRAEGDLRKAGDDNEEEEDEVLLETLSRNEG